MALLHTLAFTALRLCVAQLDGFTARLSDALATAAGQTESADDAALLRHAREHLDSGRATFQRLAGECLQQELLRAVEAAGEHASAGLASGAMDLSLITFDAMERKVLIDNLSQVLDGRHADLLAVLSMRVAHWLQAEEIGAAQNPFRSEVFLRAVSDAWRKFDLQGAAHRLVLRQMRPDVFLRLDDVWLALNQEFALRQVLPDAEEKYRQRKAASQALPAPSRVDVLRQWLAPEGVLKVIDARATCLLDAAFLHLQNQDRIPTTVRALVARLQPAIARVALADKNFFFDDRHPARRLLESLFRAGLGCAPEKSADDPGASALGRLVAPVLSERESPLDGFDDTACALDALADEEDRKLDDRMALTIADAIKQENVSHAQRQAEQDVLARIASGEVPGFIEIFLQSHWTRVLAYAHGMQDSKPEILPVVLHAMDDLIRSVQPRPTPEARKELLEGLPSLLSLLNTWLDVVKWEGADRETFFATLAALHATAMRAPVEKSARAQLEMRMEVMQKASEHELGRRIQEQQEAALADYLRMMDGLHPGDWAEFVRNDGSRLNCKLLWVSPGRNRFIFAGRQGQLLFTLADDAFAHALRADRVELIPAGRLVEQALTAALREIGVAGEQKE